MAANKQNLTLIGTAVLAALALSGCRSTSNVEPEVQSGIPAPKAVLQLKRTDELQNEVRELRNQIEEFQFEMENMRQRQQDLFQGLDQRLRVVENTRQTKPSSAPLDEVVVTDSSGVGQAGTSLPPLQNAEEVSSQSSPGNEIPIIDAPAQEVVMEPPGADQQVLYDLGFDHLKRSQYAEAISKFSALVSQFPNGGLADDASYWIGEANYVNRQYEAAISAFRKVIVQYPSSDRVPEALLKVGYVQYDIGDYQAAKETFTDVIRRYPGHPVVISAKSRIERIDRGINN